MTERQGVHAHESTSLPSSAAPSGTTRCLLPLLQPFRHCLHPFLRDPDAAHLLQASRSTASLLSGYAFDYHVFPTHTVADLKRTAALYGRYDMRIRRMCLSRDWDEPLVDSETGGSLLPASLLSLSLGEPPARSTRRAAVRASSAGSVDVDERLFYRRMRPIDTRQTWKRSGSFLHKTTCTSAFSQPLPPGALPHGLRFLQLNREYNQPLQPSSIPATVEALELGREFNQPLAAGHLPVSLTQLAFDIRYSHSLLPGVLPASLTDLEMNSSDTHPLLPGVLPSGLRRLTLRSCQHPMQPGTLPPRLQSLRLRYHCEQPLALGVIPPSVTHLFLHAHVQRPLQAGSIPHGVSHLTLLNFQQPLLPGLLPASLRELVINPNLDHPHSQQPLQLGSLPDGLELLAFHESCFTAGQPLPRGLIPASVVMVSLHKRYGFALSGIPATVRWLRLSRGRYDEAQLRDVRAAGTRIVWWRTEQGQSEASLPIQ